MPRSQRTSLDATRHYHVVSRCGTSFFCGVDVQTGRDFTHRRAWIWARIIGLAEIFPLLCARTRWCPVITCPDYSRPGALGVIQAPMRMICKQKPFPRRCVCVERDEPVVAGPGLALLKVRWYSRSQLWRNWGLLRPATGVKRQVGAALDTSGIPRKGVYFFGLIRAIKQTFRLRSAPEGESD